MTPNRRRELRKLCGRNPKLVHSNVAIIELLDALDAAEAANISLPLMFDFASFDEWVNMAQRWFPEYGVDEGRYVCLDAWGRICNIGKQFIRARDEGTFPIRVYSTRAEHQDEAAAQAEEEKP